MGENINDLSAKIGLDVTAFKAGTAEINRNIKLVESGFKAVAAGMDDWRGSSEGLETRIKALNDITDLQRQKVANLTKEHERIVAEYGESSKAAQDLQIKINRATEELNKSEKETREVTAALDQMGKEEAQAGAQAKKMGVDLKGAEKQVEGFKQQINDFAKSSVARFTTIAGGIALAVKALKELWATFKESAQWADDLNTLSAKTGIATETLQKLEYASRFVDVSMEDMQKGMSKVVMALGEAQRKGQDYIEIADGITVSMRDASGETKTSEQIFYDAVDAIGAMADATERDVAAQELFGRSYQEIMPLIEAGTGTLKKYGDEAEDAGVVIKQGMVDALQKLQDAMDKASAKNEAGAKKAVASLQAIGLGFTDLESAAKNFLPFMADAAKKIAASLLGIDEATADLYQSIIIGAQAAGLAEEEFIDQVEEMTTAILNLSYGAKTYEEASDEAFSAVVQGIDAVEVAQQQMTAAQAEYDKAVQKAYSDYVALAEQYESEVTSSTAKYLSEMGGMFGAFPEQADTSMKTLLENLNSQVVGFDQWATDIETLANRGIDEGLLAEIRAAGPEAAAEVNALATATDPELANYVTLWQTKSTLAHDAAVDALEPLADEVSDTMDAVESVLKDEAFRMEWLGQHLAEGLGNGMVSSDALKYIKSKAVEAIETALEAARVAGGIHSPSTLFRDEVGIHLGEGAGLGMIEGLESVIPRIQDGLLAMTDRLSSGAVTNNTTANTYSSTHIYQSPKALGLREIRQIQIEEEQRRSLEG